MSTTKSTTKRTTKTKVSTAVTAAVQSFADEVMTRVIAVEAGQDEVNAGRKSIMATLAATYGEQAIMRAKQGGISGNAMRTEESIKAEASRLGITPGAARELYFGIIKAINALRLNVWDDYQTAYFGEPGKKATAPKDEPENIKALKAEKAKHEKDANQYKAAAALAKATMLTAESDSDYGEAKARMAVANKAVKACTEAAKQCAASIKVTAEDNAGVDAYCTLCEALKKLGEKYKAHKDEETAELAKQVLALL